jgi:DNA-binding response OmpR family regulator
MANRHLLVVEDDLASRRAIRTVFTLRGWDVSSVATVTEALRLLDPPPDCVLLDLMLPDGEGEAVLRAVRNRNLPTRVVVTTGSSDPDRLRDLDRMGPDAVLNKPLNVNDVCRACRD